MNGNGNSAEPRYEGGAELTEDNGAPGGTVGFSMQYGALSLDILGGGGKMTTGTKIDLERDQLIDLLAAARMALDAHDEFWARSR